MSTGVGHRLRRVSHLARRFFGALVPGGPSAADEAWARDILGAEMFPTWSTMPGHDRRHSVGVARRVQVGLAGTDAAEDDRWLAAALVHDLGKLDSGLGVFGRVAATLVRGGLGDARTDRWVDRRGIRGAFGRYLQHGPLGADRIRALNGSEPVARWAAAHHERSAWTQTGIPPAVVAVLDAADDD